MVVDVSIIIVNFNTCKLVRNCIQSIREKTADITYEIIVVDNDSRVDDSKVLLPLESVTFIQAKENVGFGRANNLGASVAHGLFILFLNPDTLLLNNAIFEMVSFLKKENNVGACGGNLFDASGEPTHSFSRLYPSITKDIDFALKRGISKLLYGRNHEFNYTSRPLQVAYVTGADLMIPRYVWDAVGGFSEDFFMYYEETELEKRIRNTGYRIYSQPSACIMHLEGRSFSVSIEREKRVLRGRFVFFHKVYSRAYNKVADALNILMYTVAWVSCRMLQKIELSNKYKIRRGLYIDEMRRWS